MHSQRKALELVQEKREGKRKGKKKGKMGKENILGKLWEKEIKGSFKPEK
jgi:hypothetical protein